LLESQYEKRNVFNFVNQNIFQIPYLLMLFGAGLPLFFLEISLGQFAGVGPIKLFESLSPVFRGLGHVSHPLEFFRYCGH